MSALISPTASPKLDLTILSIACRGEERHWKQKDEGGVKLSKIKSPSWRHCKNISEVTTGLCCLFPRNVRKSTIDMILWVASEWSITSFHNSILLNASAFRLHHPQTSACWTFLDLSTWFHTLNFNFMQDWNISFKKLPLHFCTMQTIIFPEYHWSPRGRINYIK